jgi:hypothetical protein
MSSARDLREDAMTSSIRAVDDGFALPQRQWYADALPSRALI